MNSNLNDNKNDEQVVNENDNNLENSNGLNDMEKEVFYKTKWFCILMLVFIFPVGLYLMFKYMKWEKNTKIIVAAVAGLFFLFFVLSTTVFATEYEFVATQTHETAEASKTYTVPKTPAIPAKEAVYEEQKSVTVNVGDENANQEGAYGGEDIPVGDYKITNVDASDEKYCTLFKTPADDFEYVPSGSQVKKNQEITITDSNKLVAYNCDGGMTVTLTPSGEPKVVTPAVAEVPEVAEHDSTETLSYKDGEYTCSIDGKSTDCSELKYFDELKTEADNSKVEVVEEVTYDTKLTNSTKDDVLANAVCTKDGIVVDCGELTYSAELEQDLKEDMKTLSDNII